MDSPCEGQILLVGDGDFSFTVSLLKHSSIVGNQITTSNLETSETIQQHKQAAENMNSLLNMGAAVLLEIDACELHTHPVINKKYYHRIIFNFPLADRHNIKKNRSLLADFFSSCSHILAENGQVMITLCKGQGGTPADQPLRSWHDSWQVLAMATNAGFVLTRVDPFSGSLYPEYHSVGFRFQDKSFNTDGALTHIFEKADTVNVNDDFNSRAVFLCDDSAFSCSQYIAGKISRNLLLEEHNPLCLVRRRLEKSFQVHLNALKVPDQQSWCLVEGHQTKMFLRRSNQLSSVAVRKNPQNKLDVSTTGSLERIKEKKNEANICTMMKDQKTLELKHGVENGSQEKISPTQDASSATRVYLQSLIPDNSESVYIFIKKTKYASEREPGGVIPEPGPEEPEPRPEEPEPGPEPGPEEPEPGPEEPEPGPEEPEPGPEEPGPGPKEPEPGPEEPEPGPEEPGPGPEEPESQCIISEDTRQYETRTLSKPDEENGKIDDVGDKNKVFHYRTSLLENLENLCSLNDSSETRSTGGHVIGNCVFMSGQCFTSCSIQPDRVPLQHQMVIVQKLHGREMNDEQLAKCSESPDLSQLPDFFSQSPDGFSQSPDGFSQSPDIPEYELAASCLISVLQSSTLFSGSVLSLQTSGSDVIEWSKSDCLGDIKFLHIQPQEGDDGVNGSRYIGVISCLTRGGNRFCVCLIKIDDIVANICGIADPRLLCSPSLKFTQQFNDVDFPKKFSPFSLYPMKFAHDLSFWEDGDFAESELYEIIRCTAGDQVVKVTLIDLYNDASTGRVSRCYRLHFLSHDKALSYLTSWKLQSVIRISVAQKLKITLR